MISLIIYLCRVLEWGALAREQRNRFLNPPLLVRKAGLVRFMGFSSFPLFFHFPFIFHLVLSVRHRLCLSPSICILYYACLYFCVRALFVCCTVFWAMYLPLEGNCFQV